MIKRIKNKTFAVCNSSSEYVEHGCRAMPVLRSGLQQRTAGEAEAEASGVARLPACLARGAEGTPPAVDDPPSLAGLTSD